MDDILLRRLRLINDKLTTDLEIIPDIVNSENLMQAQIAYSKLEASLKRLGSYLIEYFRLASTPASDEICLISEVQLQAEETLAELKVKIDQVTSTNKPSEKLTEPNSSCRLPKLQLPVYSGDVLAWCEFWDVFRSNIDSRNLPEVDKLSYLKTSVAGDAKKAIDGLSTTNANYDIAVSILKERFGKTSHLIDAHYAALYKVKMAKGSAEDCRKTFNEIEKHLKILESLGEDINHNHLRFMLLEKFPSELVYEIKLKVNDESIQELRGQLDRIITAKEDSERISGRKRPHETEDSTVGTLHINAKRAKYANQPQPQHSNQKKQNQQGGFDRRSVQIKKFIGFKKQNKGNRPNQTQTSNKGQSEPQPGPSGEKKEWVCVFCKGNHFNDKCTEATTLVERKKRLGKRCFLCFKLNHFMKDCKIGQGRPGEETVVTVLEEGITTLQTAIVYANPLDDKNKQYKYRLLLDPGSQRSYVTFQTAKELKLPVEEESHLVVFTFGDDPPKEIHSPIVTLQLLSRTNKKIVIRVNCVERISRGYIPNVKMKDLPETYVLADDGSLSGPVQILVGNEYYCNITYEKKVQLDSNLFLIDSALGWIISGRTESQLSDEPYVVTYTQTCIETKLHQPDPPLCDADIKSLWELECIGISDSPRATREEEAIKRVEEIRKNKDLEIRYLSTDLNPADVGTRPTCSREDREKWLTGPQFIVEDPKTWPTTSSSGPTSSLLIGEGLGIQEEEPMETVDPDIPDVSPMETRHSATAKEVTAQENDQTPDDKFLRLKEIQAEYFPLEVEGKVTSLSLNLGVFKDIDDLLRCKGRMKHADWSFDKRYPILIPKNSDFTNETIMKIHRENMHVGVSHTLSKIRETYWIPQGRSKVQNILRKCPECKKHDGGPYKLPETPALPKERVNYSSPFTYVGTDYLGPLLVNNGNGSCKRWISLYTCLAVRAIHLEVVKDLTAEEGLMALRRMISTRGVPSLITSDNAAHYKLLSEILQIPYCLDKEIRWKFIPQLAPWHGGFYERLVGLVKNCMKKTLQKHLLNDSQLVTAVKEIEAVLNTRPLTYVDSEPDHVLKPSDFLTMGKCITMETSNKDPTSQGTVTKDNLIKGWKKAQIILREFKEMFENRYLLNLRERYSHHPKEPRVTSKLEPKIGQIVQIKGDTRNRINWKVGKIVSLRESADGLCRVATVRVGDTEYTRSITHLYPLEIEEGEEHCKQTSPYNESAEEPLQLPDLPPPSCGNVDVQDVAESPSEQRFTPVTARDDPEEEVLPYASPVEERSSFKQVVESTSSKLNEPKPKSMSEPEPLAVVDPEYYDHTDPELHHLEEIAPEGQEDESRPKRAAALRALEKIKEWTSNLVAVLLPEAGSVATDANL
ncbi:uncharacterized protein LOC134742857 [Cydia strobilella]|uniref:uncharacterized protein LOC134742857 n=3 Tax=Cydia strobilella TaxID=1100964 RepID=UPI003003B6FD